MNEFRIFTNKFVSTIHIMNIRMRCSENPFCLWLIRAFKTRLTGLYRASQSMRHYHLNPFISYGPYHMAHTIWVIWRLALISDKEQPSGFIWNVSDIRKDDESGTSSANSNWSKSSSKALFLHSIASLKPISFRSMNKSQLGNERSPNLQWFITVLED